MQQDWDRVGIRSLNQGGSNGNRKERGRIERLFRKNQHYPGTDWIWGRGNESKAVGWVRGGGNTTDRSQGVCLRKALDWRRGKG